MARGLRLAACALGLALVSAVGDCHVAVYVDANASGAEDGSKAHPYKTIQKAIDQTSIPVAVVIAPGTYAGFTISGRSGVSFQSASATKPVIDGTALMSTLITITGSTDIELRGLAIEVNQRDAVLATNGSSVTLAGVTIDGPPAPPWPSAPPSSRLVVADPGTTVTIVASTLTGGRVAVYQLGPSSFVKVQGGSLFSHNYTGAWLLDGADFDIGASTIEYSSDCGILAGSNLGPGTVNLHSGTAIRWPGLIGLATNSVTAATVSDSVIQVGKQSTPVNSQHAGSTVIATNSTFDGGQFGPSASSGGYLELVHCTVKNSGRAVSSEFEGSNVIVRGGTVVQDNSIGVESYFGGLVTIDGSSILRNGEGVKGWSRSSLPTDPSIIIRNGSVVADSIGNGLNIGARNRLLVSSSAVQSNGTDGIVCDGAVCDVGAGVGLGNTIAGHSGAGQYGIRCLNAGVVNCTAGENAFSDNATDIDPVCAATCAR